MTIEINEEQISYIKSLDSDKDRKEFLLTAIIGNITSLGESARFDGRLAYEDKQVEPLKITDLQSKTYVRNGDKFYAEGHSFKTNDQISIKSADGKIIKKGVVKKVYLPNEFKVILQDSSWGNMPYCNLIIELEDSKSSKISDFPSVKYTLTGDSVRDSIGLGIEGLSVIRSAYEKASELKDELLKFDKLEEEYSLDEKDNFLAWVYNRLLLKYKENPLFDYMHKLREIALKYDEFANSEKKYTEEDMQIAFYKGRSTEKKEELIDDGKHLPYYADVSFKEWLSKYINS